MERTNSKSLICWLGVGFISTVVASCSPNPAGQLAGKWQAVGNPGVTLRVDDDGNWFKGGYDLPVAGRILSVEGNVAKISTTAPVQIPGISCDFEIQGGSEAATLHFSDCPPLKETFRKMGPK